jgi:hypothetical protein
VGVLDWAHPTPVTRRNALDKPPSSGEPCNPYLAEWGAEMKPAHALLAALLCLAGPVALGQAGQTEGINES